MTKNLYIPDAFIFMKVGKHANESFQQILLRKQAEIDKVGFSYWGYSGPLCHPVKQVIPFIEKLNSNKSIPLLMSVTNSNFIGNTDANKEFSIDKNIWFPIQKEILVTGSKHALVLKNIEVVNLDLNLHEYNVGIGPSMGRQASNYIKNRIDKACLIRSFKQDNKADCNVNISFIGELTYPYSVFVK